MSFYKMERGWLDSPMWGEEAYSKREAFEWMIGEAAWDDNKVVAMPNGKPLRLKRGQVYASIRFMARKFQWSENKVIRYLEFLAVWGAIETQTNTGQTVITICNYSKYQDGGNTGEYRDEHANGNALGDADGNTGEYKQQETQETLRKKEEGNAGAFASDPAFEKFWEIYPRQRRGSKEKARKAYVRALSRASPDEIHAACEAYAASDEVARGFAKGCEAWLNDDRWTVDYTQKGTGNAKTGQFGGNDGYKGSRNPRGKHERARSILLGDTGTPVIEG